MPESREASSGLVGAGIQHSSSPSMHVDEGKALGLQISYELLDFDLMQGGAERLPALLDEAEQTRLLRSQHHLPVEAGRDPAAGRACSGSPRASLGQHRAVSRWQTHRAQHGLVGLRGELQARHVRRENRPRGAGRSRRRRRGGRLRHAETRVSSIDCARHGSFALRGARRTAGGTVSGSQDRRVPWTTGSSRECGWPHPRNADRHAKVPGNSSARRDSAAATCGYRKSSMCRC